MNNTNIETFYVSLYKTTRNAKLGVRFMMDKNGNVVVASVRRGSPLSKTKIKAGDIVKEIQGRSIIGKNSHYAAHLVANSKGPVTMSGVHTSLATRVKSINRLNIDAESSSYDAPASKRRKFSKGKATKIPSIKKMKIPSKKRVRTPRSEIQVYYVEREAGAFFSSLENENPSKRQRTPRSAHMMGDNIKLVYLEHSNAGNRLPRRIPLGSPSNVFC